MLLKSYFRVGGLLALLLATASCAEKKSSSPAGPQTGSSLCDQTKDPSCKPAGNPTQTPAGGQASALADVCGGMTQNSSISEFSSLTGLLCANGTSGLQALVADGLYTGGANSTVKDLQSEELTGKQSKIRFLSAMRIATKPLSYFNMMKLQITQPQQFKSAGFETDEKVTYEVKSAQSDSAVYHYRNPSDEVVVDYTAKAKFVTVIPDKVYLITTSLDTSATTNETVTSLKGYSLMFVSTATTTDVIGISDQTYENNGNHGTTLSKAKRGAQTEQMRSYRNGLISDKANSLVK